MIFRLYPIASTVRSQLMANTTIMASKYQLYLLTTEQLIKEIDEVKQSAQKKEK